MMNYYAHTISKYDNFMLSDLENLENILKSGYLLSRRKLGLNKSDALFNGMDYISLTDLSKKDNGHSSYMMYTKKGLSLLFNKDIDVVTPKIIYLDSRHVDIGKKMHNLGLRGRFSDLSDEVQVKDRLSLEYLKGLTLSLDRIESFHSDDYVNYYLYYTLCMLKEYGYNLPIIDLGSEKEIEIDKIKRYV